MIAGGVAAIAILLMAMFMQSQKKPKRGGSKTGKRRKAVRRPRQVHDDSEE
jgi:predicted MFS family arabinose efflux permease